jgi:hypothetical protein
VVGRRITISFKTERALDQLAQISTPDGTFSRRYLIRNGTGFIDWIPTRAGRAVVHVRARGHQGQTAEDSARITVAPARRTPRAKAKRGKTTTQTATQVTAERAR